MTGILENGLNRRSLLGALGAGAGAMLLGGCATYETRVTNVIERLLLLSSQRAFARLTAPGGFWDQQIAQAGLDNFLGARGNVLAGILTSGLVKSRLEREFAGFAVEASERAAPIIYDSIQLIGVENTIGLITGGPGEVVTDLAILGFDPETRAMGLESLHPGVSLAQVQENTGFDLLVPGELPETDPPEDQELRMLRSLDPDGRFI